MVKGEYIEIVNMPIVYSSETEDENILLESYVTDSMPFEDFHHGYDAVMDSNYDAIRVGKPSISLSNDKVFIKSDPIPSSTTTLPKITITEGDVPIIRKHDLNGINITLPQEMHWRDISDILVSVDGGDPDYDVNDYLDLGQMNVIDFRTLNIPVLKDFIAGQSIILENGKIIPLNITDSIEAELASCITDLNDKSNNLEYWSSENLMVNDVNIRFTSSYEHENDNGGGSHSFVFTDQYAYLSPIDIVPERAGDSNFNSNIFEGLIRKFTVEIPQNLTFTSDFDILCDV